MRVRVIGVPSSVDVSSLMMSWFSEARMVLVNSWPV